MAQTKLQKERSKPKGLIPAEEQEICAKVFTIGNLGMDDYIERANGKVNSAFREVDGIMQFECGTSIMEEHRDWVKFAKEGSEITLEMWTEEKAKWNKKGIILSL